VSAGEEGRRPGGFCGLPKEGEGGIGRLGRREKGRGGKGRRFSFLFLNPFQIHFSNFQTSIKEETMHSNHVAQAIIIF
jgi:hypothetical protein